jgi:hypothetical protein
MIVLAVNNMIQHVEADRLKSTPDNSNFTPGVVVTKTQTPEPLDTPTSETALCITPEVNMRVRDRPSLQQSVVFAQIDAETEHVVVEEVENSEGQWVKIRLDGQGLTIFVRPSPDDQGSVTGYVAQEIEGFEYFEEPQPCSVIQFDSLNNDN